MRNSIEVAVEVDAEASRVGSRWYGAVLPPKPVAIFCPRPDISVRIAVGDEDKSYLVDELADSRVLRLQKLDDDVHARGVRNPLARVDAALVVHGGATVFTPDNDGADRVPLH